MVMRPVSYVPEISLSLALLLIPLTETNAQYYKKRNYDPVTTTRTQTRTYQAPFSVKIIPDRNRPREGNVIYQNKRSGSSSTRYNLNPNNQINQANRRAELFVRRNRYRY